MADLSKIQFKRSTTTGSVPTSLSAGELALNVKDARLFSSDGTNIIEFGLSKGGTIDGSLTINGSITTSGGGVFAAQDGNVYLNKSGATGWIDSLFLRKDVSNTMNGTFTATGNVVANSGLFTSNDGYHYLRMGVSGTNNYTFGNYGGTYSFLNSNGNGSVLSLSPGSASFSDGTGSVSLKNIIFPGNSNGSNSNNDYSRGVGFTIENVDTSSSNYPTSMGSLMTSVLNDVRVFQLFAESGSQGLHFRSMRNDGSGNVGWSELYSTSNKPSPSDVGSYSTSQSDSLFAPKANFSLNGSDAHMKGNGSYYFFMNGNGASGVYSNHTVWAFDSNGNLANGNVPVSSGGTGATNASDARSNLGLGNGAEITYLMPGHENGKPGWLRIGRVNAAGTASAFTQIRITGVGNYGVDSGEFNLISISGRFNTSATTTNMVTHRRSNINSNDITVGYVANTTTSGNTTTTTSYDVYMKDNSGWCSGAQLTVLSSAGGGYFSGGISNGSFDSWLESEPSKITYVNPSSLGVNSSDGSSIKINGEFVSSNSNGVRIANGDNTNSNSTLLRTDGSNFNILISPNGVSTGNNWGTLRPFQINLSNGLMTVGHGADISGAVTARDSLTVSNGVINTNDPSHYIDLGKNGNNAAKWVVYNGQHSFVNGNGNTTTTQFNNGTITTAGSISTTSDNTAVVVGNNGDIALVKKSGLNGKLVFGKNNSFVVAQSSNASISATDNATNVFSVDGSGNTHAYGSLQVDGSLQANGAISSAGGYLSTNGGFGSSFLPGAQGAYIGWNFPSGNGATIFINHKGGGSGGYFWYNSDGKTNTQLANLDSSGALRLSGGLAATGITASNGLTVSSGDLKVPNGIIYGKDGNHSIDMRTDNYVFNTYNGQFFFRNTNGNAQAQLSYSGNIRGSQWGGGWLNDYMEGRYANVTGQTFTGSVNFANNAWNRFGDDVQIGDRNVSGGLAIQGLTGDTTLALFEKGSTAGSTNYKIVASGNNLGLYAPNNVNIHGSGGLYVDGVGSFGGSLGAASLSISGSSTIFNLNVSSGLTVNNSATINGGLTSNGVFNTSGTATFGGTIEANGQININNGGLVVKNGVGSADGSGNYYTSGYRVSGRPGQFVDTYYQEITGSYAYYGIHVKSGSADGWYEFRNNGDFHTGGSVITGNNIGVGGAVYQTDGNLSGSAWGGYLSDYMRNNFVAGIKQSGRVFIGGLNGVGDYTSRVPAGAWLVSALTNGDDRITGAYYSFVMYQIGGNWVNTGN